MEKREKRKKILLAVWAVLAAGAFFGLGWMGSLLSLGARDRALLWAIEKTKENYYEEVDEDALYDSLFGALALDIYSDYYTREEYREVEREDAGINSGTGIYLTGDAEARIYMVVGGSSAHRAGLAAGQYILRFGASPETLTEGTRAELLSFAQETRGALFLEAGYDPAGSDAAVYEVESGEYTASYCLYRDGETALRYDPATKGFSEDRAGALAGLPADTAYLRLEGFHADMAVEAEGCLTYMREHGKEDLILDLRENGGGMMSVLQKTCALFLREEGRPVIATARYRDGSETSFTAKDCRAENFFGEHSRIFILADENTASASECLIGALLSYGAADISDVFIRRSDGGVKTYGKGIMQSSFRDPAGNVLKLTTARVFWPNGVSIHGSGVTDEMGARAVEAPLLPAFGGDAFLAEVLSEISETA